MELEYNAVIYLRAETRFTIDENTVRNIRGAKNRELTSEDWDEAALKIANQTNFLENLSFEDLECDSVEIEYRG